MALKYAGKCQACGRALAVGDSAWYDPADRTVTCREIECAHTRGLVVKVWRGSPISGRYVDTLTDVSHGTYDYIRDPGEDMADRFMEGNGR